MDYTPVVKIDTRKYLAQTTVFAPAQGGHVPDIFNTEILEIRYDKVFPAGIVTEFFEIQHGDFHGVRERVLRDGSTAEPSFRFVDQKGKTVAHFTRRSMIDDHITRVMRGRILSTAWTEDGVGYGPAKHELNIMHTSAKKALGKLNLPQQTRQAVLLYFSIRESGEEQDPARKVFEEELKEKFKKMAEDAVNTLYKSSLRIGERLWHDAFMEFYY